MFNLFGKKGEAIKKWHAKAMLINFRKTKLTILTEEEKTTNHMPPWVNNKFSVELPTWIFELPTWIFPPDFGFLGEPRGEKEGTSPGSLP